MQMWRMGEVSKDTEADIVVLRALVLYNAIHETTVQAILEGLRQLNGLAMSVCEEYNVGVYRRSIPLTGLAQNSIVEYDYRISLPCNPGVWIRVVNIGDTEAVDERVLKEMLVLMVGVVATSCGGVEKLCVPDDFGAKSKHRLRTLVKQLK